MTRIGFDIRAIGSAAHPGAGIAHATNALMEALQKQALFFDVKIIGVNPRGFFGWRDAIRRERLDAMIFPSGAVPFSFFCAGLPVPFFVWVHDLSIFDHPEWFPQSRWKRKWTTFLFLRGLRRARHVFAVSEDTKRAVMRHAGIAAENITVTGEGAGEQRAENGARQKHTAMIFGTVEPRKNIPFIVSLWSEVRRRVNDARLIIAGEDGWGNVHWTKMEGVERKRGVTDAERDRLMRETSVILVPSLHEGFGRAALEGMAAGTPVIASDRGALPEVVGDGGILLEPDDRQGWIEAICRMFEDAAFVESIAEKGRRRSELFSWQETAKVILAKIAAK